MGNDPNETVQEKMRRLGSMGGKKTVERYGKAHMSELGKAGFAAARDGAYEGDARALFRRLRNSGKIAKGVHDLKGYYTEIARTGNADLTLEQFEKREKGKTDG